MAESGSKMTAISCERETLETVKRLKRGGENYDDLLMKMADQYRPDGEHSVQ